MDRHQIRLIFFPCQRGPNPEGSLRDVPHGSKALRQGRQNQPWPESQQCLLPSLVTRDGQGHHHSNSSTGVNNGGGGGDWLLAVLTTWLIHAHLRFRKMIVSPAFLSLFLRILTVGWPAVHLTPVFKVKLIGVVTSGGHTAHSQSSQ